MTFAALFGRPPAVVACAPGRVNLIGEHTDYNDGFVLPAPIPQQTEVQLAPAPGRMTVRAWSANLSGDATDTARPRDPAAMSGDGAGIRGYELGREQRSHDWLDYVRGVTQVLRADGHRLEGFDLRVSTDVPLGSGLSSSAALEIALLRALRQAFALPLSDVDLARIGQRAENDLVGAPVGIMDQMASSLGQPGQAIFLDTADLSFQLVPLPASLDLIVIDSLVRHQHSSGEYRTRRAECDRACAALGVRTLRDLDPTPARSLADADRRPPANDVGGGATAASGVSREGPDTWSSRGLPDTLAAALDALPDPIGRRARHVVTENRRVRQMVDALRAERLETCGRLLYEGHASLRDDFEISVPPIDRLVEVARAQADVLGARMTGGGFGGSIVALTRAGAGRRAADAIVARYRATSGQDAEVLVPR